VAGLRNARTRVGGLGATNLAEAQARELAAQASARRPSTSPKRSRSRSNSRCGTPAASASPGGSVASFGKPSTAPAGRSAGSETPEAFLASVSPLTLKNRDDMAVWNRVALKLFSHGGSAARLRETFRKMNTDGDGTVSYEELRAGLRHHNLDFSDVEFARLWKAADADRSGAMDYEEFMGMFEHFQPLEPPAEKRRADNVMVAAPWEPVRGEFKAFNRAATRVPDENFEPGSYEEQAHDHRTLQLISRRFQQAESRLRLIFRRFDTDKNGTVSRDEFFAGMKKIGLGMSDKQLSRFMDMVDTDGSGAIDYEEFISKFEEASPLAPEQGPVKAAGARCASSLSAATTTTTATTTLPDDATVARVNANPLVRQLREKLYQKAGSAKQLFRQYDVNGDGYLSNAEMGKVVAMLAPQMDKEEVNTLVFAMDPSGDGYLNYREFCNFVADGGRAPLGDVGRADARQRNMLGSTPIDPRSTSALSCRSAATGAGTAFATPASRRSATATPFARASPAETPPSGGRFSSGTGSAATRWLLQPAEGTPGFLAEAERLRSKSAAPIDAEIRAAERHSRASRAESRRAKAAQTAYRVKQRQNFDMDRHDRVYEARLETLANAKRRYRERALLYDPASLNVPQHKQKNGGRSPVKGFHTFFMEGS